MPTDFRKEDTKCLYGCCHCHYSAVITFLVYISAFICPNIEEAADADDEDLRKEAMAFY